MVIQANPNKLSRRMIGEERRGRINITRHMLATSMAIETSRVRMTLKLGRNQGAKKRDFDKSTRLKSLLSSIIYSKRKTTSSSWSRMTARKGRL